MDLAMLRLGRMGGNSNFRDTMRRADKVKSKGLHFVDGGTGGGIWGLTKATA